MHYFVTTWILVASGSPQLLITRTSWLEFNLLPYLLYGRIVGTFSINNVRVYIISNLEEWMARLTLESVCCWTPSAVHIWPVQPCHDPAMIEWLIFNIVSIWSQTRSDFWLCLSGKHVLVNIWLTESINVLVLVKHNKLNRTGTIQDFFQKIIAAYYLLTESKYLVLQF